MEWYLGPLRKYTEFEGRARRKEYWFFLLMHIGVAIILFAVGEAISSGLGVVLYLVYILATLVPALALFVRRLHDIDKSGWWLLLNFVPFGAIVLLVFTLTEGKADTNQYGVNPKVAAA